MRGGGADLPTSIIGRDGKRRAAPGGDGMLGWLFGAGAGAPRDVALYTRAGCHLCDDAHEELLRAARRYPLELRVIDVDRDPALAERYGLEVPVVAIDGRVRFRGRVNRVLLERLLRAGAGSRRG